GFGLHRRPPAQFAEGWFSVGDAEKLPGVLVCFEATQVTAGGGDDDPPADGAGEMLHCFVKVADTSWAWIGIREGLVVFQIGEDRLQSLPELVGRLVKIDDLRVVGNL